MALFISLWIRLFFVFTPFFGLTMFLSMTEGYDEQKRRRLAISVSAAVLILCMVLFFAGKQIFGLFGITLDSFRIGAGALLFLSGVALVQGKAGAGRPASGEDVAVVPLAIPVIVGPATTGTSGPATRLSPITATACTKPFGAGSAEISSVPDAAEPAAFVRSSMRSGISPKRISTPDWLGISGTTGRSEMVMAGLALRFPCEVAG